MPVPRIGRVFTESRDVENKTVTVTSDAAVAVTPDAAAEVLMEFLPMDTQTLLREASEHMVVPMWQMLLGYVMRCHDGALMYSPFLLSSWETGGKPNKPRPCKGCGELFSSRFPDAAYCCNACAFEKLEVFGHHEDCPVRRPEIMKV